MEVIALKAREHMGVVLIIGLGMFQDDPMGLIYTPLMIAGSILPDIDTPFSKLGRFNPLSPFMRHRGITHSLLGAFVIGVLGIIIHATVGIWVTVGYLTHLLLDSLTPAGIDWLYPFKR